jgi:outer membrane protein assembly factor BamB
VPTSVEVVEVDAAAALPHDEGAGALVHEHQEGVFQDLGGPGVISVGITVLVVAAAMSMLIGVDGRVVAPRAAPASTNWTTYHGNTLESGIAPTALKLSHPTPAWTSPSLDGALYGEPLIDNNVVVVATENDTVYALHASDGTIAWSTSVGTPVAASSLPCGDITPTVGVTSTPVIDTSRSEVFVVADEQAGGQVSHHLVGLDLGSGSVLLDQVVDPSGSIPTAQLQRAALTVDQGSVLIGFGGNFGDCSTYHGWVVSVPEDGGQAKSWEVDATAVNDRGALWMGGAGPVVDRNGNIWVATGNGSNTTGASPDGSDSVVELSSSLQVLQSFTPSTWQTDNASDADLGSAPPSIMGNGFVFQAGKSQRAYLLDASNLGGVGGQVAQLSSFCGSVVDGGTAFTSSVVYVPCGAGVEAVRITTSKRTMRVLWTSSTGASGPPIVAGGKVWTMSHAGTLYGLKPSNGKPVVQLTVGAPKNHFPTPAVGAGLLVAASSNTVVAFH